MSKFFLSLSAVLFGLTFTSSDIFGNEPKGSRHSGGHRSSASRGPAHSRQSPTTHRASSGTTGRARHASRTHQPRKPKAGTVTKHRRPGRSHLGTSKARARRNLTARAMHRKDGPRKGFKSWRPVRNYYRKYGKQFTFRVKGVAKRGWYYPGAKHFNWRYFRWNSQYRKWFFFDPGTRVTYVYSYLTGSYVPAMYYLSSGEDEEDELDNPGVLPSGEVVEEAYEIPADNADSNDTNEEGLTE